jgi:hypothetical protein
LLEPKGVGPTSWVEIRPMEELNVIIDACSATLLLAHNVN